MFSSPGLPVCVFMHSLNVDLFFLNSCITRIVNTTDTVSGKMYDKNTSKIHLLRKLYKLQIECDPQHGHNSRNIVIWGQQN